MIFVKKNVYPNPCDTCELEPTCRMGYGCQAWQVRYRYRQKQINAYAKKQREKYFSSRWVYPHQNEVYRFLREWPCGKCGKEPDCEIPCSDYLRWYNARIAVARMKLSKE